MSADMRPDTLVYLSGPITARDGFTVEENCDQAIRVFRDLLRRGIPAFCPHLSGDEPTAAGLDYETWLAYDLAVLVRCTHVLLLPRWATSPGARREVAFARRRGIPVVHTVDALDRALEPARCNHKFVDSLRCLKCGWTPAAALK